jgi:hypothetical protein
MLLPPWHPARWSGRWNRDDRRPEVQWRQGTRIHQGHHYHCSHHSYLESERGKRCPGTPSLTAWAGFDQGVEEHNVSFLPISRAPGDGVAAARTFQLPVMTPGRTLGFRTYRIPTCPRTESKSFCES